MRTYVTPKPWRSSAVVHAGVVHAEDRGVLVHEEPGVDDLADEEGVVPGSEALPHLAVDVRDRLLEDRRAAHLLDVREPVQRLGTEVDVDRLRELPDDGPVLDVDE